MKRYGALALTLFVFLSLRRAGAWTTPQFWAEDGAIFFRDQVTMGTWAALWSPYAGYLAIIPRLIAAFADVFPLLWAPWIYALAAHALDALCLAVFALPWFRQVLASDRLRWISCLLAATATYGMELNGAALSVQWYVLPAGALLVFAERPVGRPWLWALGGALAALSAPVLVIVLPFCLWRIWRRRDRSVVYEAALTAGLVVQLALFAIWRESAPQQPGLSLLGTIDRAFGSAVLGFEIRGLLWTCFGVPVTSFLLRSHVIGFLLTGIAVVPAALLAFWTRLDGRRRHNLVIALYLAASSMVSTLVPRHVAELFAGIGSYPLEGGERYFFLTACVCIYLLALAVERFRLHWALLPAACALAVAGNYRYAPLPDHTRWAERAPQVQRWRDSFQRGKPVERLWIPTVPEPWGITLDR